ncbi:hypothetical protein NNG48_07055 [Enterococcus faecium]|nr:hypothetical protein [Enterococcus faecium]
MAQLYMTKGKEIKRRRFEMNVTAVRMAEVLEVPVSFIRGYEKGDVLTYEIVEEISWFLHCEVSDIAYEYA